MKTYIYPQNLKAKPQDESKLGFGKIFTDHMFLMNYERLCCRWCCWCIRDCCSLWRGRCALHS